MLNNEILLFSMMVFVMRTKRDKMLTVAATCFRHDSLSLSLSLSSNINAFSQQPISFSISTESYCFYFIFSQNSKAVPNVLERKSSNCCVISLQFQNFFLRCGF